jgi:hypothetical protein
MTQSKNTRIAYLKRMLKRLEDEDSRIERLVSEGELSSEGADIGIRQLKKSREELVSELKSLQQKM